MHTDAYEMVCAVCVKGVQNHKVIMGGIKVIMGGIEGIMVVECHNAATRDSMA